jgi:heat shock protein HslJ/uncharacterized lipoprotein NlpE involved in copper resistance
MSPGRTYRGTPARRLRTSLAAALAWALVVPVGACRTAPAGEGEAPLSTVAGGELPASFQGLLPCADCPGILQTLNLYPDGRFTLRLVYLDRGPEAHFDETGRFRLSPAGDRLHLDRDEGQGPDQYAVRGDGVLRQLDLEGREIESQLNFDLRRTAELVPLEDETAGAAPSGEAPGVAMIPAGAPGGRGAVLEDRPWRLVRLDEEPIAPGPGQDAAVLHLVSAERRIQGETGCNRLLGTYQLAEESLRLLGLATTRRACPGGAGDLERAFVGALEATVRWRIVDGPAGDQLELYDEQGRVRARFTAGDGSVG